MQKHIMSLLVRDDVIIYSGMMMPWFIFSCNDNYVLILS